MLVKLNDVMTHLWQVGDCKYSELLMINNVVGLQSAATIVLLELGIMLAIFYSIRPSTFVRTSVLAHFWRASEKNKEYISLLGFLLLASWLVQ